MDPDLNAQRLRALLEHSSMIVIEMRADGSPTYINPQCTRLLGYTLGDVQALPDQALVHPDDSARVRHYLTPDAPSPAGQAEDDPGLEVRLRRKDGTWCWVRGLVTRLRTTSGERRVLAMLDDIDAERRAKQALRESEERFVALAQNAHDLISETDEHGRVCYASPNHRSILGYEPNERIGKDALADVHPADLASQVGQELDPSSPSILRSPFRYRDAEGSWKWLESSSTSYTTADGERRIVSVTRDVTDRVEAEEALQRRAHMLDQIQECVIGVGVDGLVLYWNRAAEQILEVPREEALGTHVYDLMGRLDLDPSAVSEVRERLLDVGHYESRTSFVSPSGQESTHLTSVTLVEDGDPETAGAVAVVQDIAELEREQRRARAAEELASVATLAAGIAHDVGTPMNVILGYANLIEKSSPDEKQRQRAQIIAQQTKRVSDLVGTLLNISRPREHESLPLRVDEVVRHALQFFREKLTKRGIVVEQDFTEVPDVIGDSARLEQVFLNLFVNAADAMVSGGTLRVKLGSPDPEHVEIQVSDSGTGIEPERLKRIFDPYYTTKDRGQGTGLGLFMCKRIISEHGGTIDVTSALGSGTRFCIRLPLAPRVP